MKYLFLLIMLLPISSYSLESGDQLHFSLLNNFSSDLDLDGVKYSQTNNYSENYAIEMKSPNLGIGIEFLKNIKAMDDKKIFGDKPHRFFVSGGIEYHFKRDADKGTFAFSNGTSGSLTQATIDQIEVQPFVLYSNFHILVDESFSLFAGINYSELGFELNFVGSATGKWESEGALGFQLGAGYTYQNFRAQFTYRPGSYDMEGTYTSGGVSETTDGELEYNYMMLSLGYVL